MKIPLVAPHTSPVCGDFSLRTCPPPGNLAAQISARLDSGQSVTQEERMKVDSKMIDNKVTNGYTDDLVIEKKNRRREEWRVNASIVAKNTFNPIRDLLETMTIVPNPEKKMISLSIGDPTVFGNLLPAKEVVDAVHAALDSQKCNG